MKIVIDNHERLQETPKFFVRGRAPDVGLKHCFDRRDKGTLVLTRVVALLDAFQKVLGVSAVLGPVQNRLVMLIDAGVIGAKRDAEVLGCSIEPRL